MPQDSQDDDPQKLKEISNNQDYSISRLSFVSKSSPVWMKRYEMFMRYLGGEPLTASITLIRFIITCILNEGSLVKRKLFKYINILISVADIYWEDLLCQKCGNIFTMAVIVCR